MARICVVIPVYRRPRLVIETLETVAAQTRPPDRLVVVDDGSPDDTAASVEQWIASRKPAFPAVVKRIENRGVGGARNAGVPEAGLYDYYAFLDSDDLWEPRFLEATTNALDRHPDAVAATSDRLFMWCGRGKQRVDMTRRYVRRTTERILKEGPPGLSNTLMRASAYHAVGGYEEGLVTGEDTLLMLRLSLLGPWVHVPGTLITYRFGIGGGDEASSVSDRKDLRIHLAPLFERFLLEQGGAEALPRRVWRSIASRLWCGAAEWHRRVGRGDAARDAYRRAIDFWPWNPLARYRLWTGN